MLDMMLLPLLGYSLAFGGNRETTGTTFVGKGDSFASGVDPSFWFFGKSSSRPCWYGHYWSGIQTMNLRRNTIVRLFHCQEYTFSATATTIIAGTLAERCQMVAYLCYSIAMSGFIYPIIVHQIWSWNGFLSVNNDNPLFNQGAIDFAGSGVVHLTGGVTALYATIILGPRRGRFYNEEGDPIEPTRFPGHSVALQLLGTMVLWFGCKL
jgi:Amt family ammonium transporter